MLPLSLTSLEGNMASAQCSLTTSFFVPTKASVVVVVHTSNGRRSSRGRQHQPAVKLLTQKKKRGEGLFKNYFDVVSCEDLKATKNEGFYLISKFFFKKLRNFFSWIG